MHEAAEALAAAGASVEEVAGARAPLRPVRLLPDRPGGGLLQPGPLRRRPLRAAGGRRRRRGHEHRHPHRGVRRRGEAPDHARHLRALGRLLRRLLRPGPAGAHPGDRGLRPGLRAGRRAPRGDHPHHGLRHRRAGGRPDGHVRSRTCSPSPPTWPATRRSACPSGPATTACRSGSRCWPRPSARSCSSGWPRRWRRRRRERGLGDGGGPRGPLRAADGHQAVLRLPQRLRRRPQHQRLPGLPGAARLAAGAQRAGRRAGHADRRRAPLRGPALEVPPEELLLPRHAQGLPDQPVRRADQRGRLARPARRQPRGHHPGPHRGGHRQDHPRGRGGPHPRRRPLARRLQPLGRAAGGDRERARHALGRPGPRLRRRAAGRARGHRGLRRPHGGGVDAGRRQRVGAAGRPARRSAPAARSRTSTRCARWPGPSSTRPPARWPSSRAAGWSTRRPATGTSRRAGP